MVGLRILPVQWDLEEASEFFKYSSIIEKVVAISSHKIAFNFKVLSDVLENVVRIIHGWLPWYWINFGMHG